MRTTAKSRYSRVRRRVSKRFPITVRPTRADVEIARAMTWGADEKVLLLLAAAGWIVSRGGSERLRRAGNHALLVTVAASLLPHGLKRLFNQIRPDRMTVLGHTHGIS